MPTSLKELYKLVVGNIGLQRLQSRLYPYCKTRKENDGFDDHSCYGFLEKDTQLLPLIAEDWQHVINLGTSHREIAQALRKLISGNGILHPDYMWQEPNFYMMQGGQSCPWGCPNVRGGDCGAIFSKKDGEEKGIVINSLHPHLIEEHFFFQGKGVRYRLNPQQIIPILLLGNASENIQKHLLQALKSENIALINYGLNQLQKISAQSVIDFLTPQLEKLLHHHNKDIVFKTIETINRLSIRKLAPNIYQLFEHNQSAVSKIPETTKQFVLDFPSKISAIAQYILIKMDFLTTPIFCDLRSEDLESVAAKLQEKLHDHVNVEDVIDSLGRVGKETPRLLDFLDKYPNTAVVAVLRVIKNCPQFILSLQENHWQIIEDFAKKQQDDQRKSNSLPQNLFLHFMVAALRFHQTIPRERIMGVYELARSSSSLQEKIHLFCEYLPSVLLESEDEKLVIFLSKIIRHYLSAPLALAKERFVSQLLEFIQRSPLLPEVSVKKLSSQERREIFKTMMISENEIPWINIVNTIMYSSLFKEKIAAVCVQYIDHHHYAIRLQAIKAIGQLRCNIAIDKLIPLTHHEDRYIQNTTIRALERMDIGAEKAIPSILKLQDKSLIASILLSIGSPHGVPFLLDYIKQAPDNFFEYRSYYLKSIKDKRITQVLLDILVERESIPDVFSEVLGATLEKEQLQTCWDACNEQQKKQLLKHLSNCLRENISLCTVVISEWKKYVDHHDDDLREIVFCCIRNCITKQNAAIFIPQLLKAIEDKNHAVVLEAVRALKKIDFQSPHIVESLVDCMSKDMNLTRDREILELLVKINGGNAYGVHKFTQALDSIRDLAVLLLKNVGDMVCDILYKEVQNTQGKISHRAVYALYRINSAKSIVYLTKLITHSDAKIKTRAALRLCEHKEHCVQAVRVFLGTLQSSEKSDVETALQRLTFLSETSLVNIEEYLPELIFILSNILHIPVAQDLFFRLGTNVKVRHAIPKYREKHSQHPQSFVFDLFE